MHAYLLACLACFKRRACGCAWKYNSRRLRSDTCVYSSVVARSAWPSISCTARRSAPPSSRCVANEWRRRCGWMRSGSRPAFPARRRRMRKTPARVSPPPLALRKSSWRWRRSRCGRPRDEVAAERVRGFPSDRDDPLLASLAEGADEPVLEVYGLPVERDRLAHAQPGAVEELGESAVAEGARRGSRRPRRAGARPPRARACAAASGGASGARRSPPGCRRARRAAPGAGRRSGRRQAGARRSSARGRPRGAARRRRRDRRRSRPRASGPASAVRWARSRRYASTVRGARRAEARARKPSTAGSDCTLSVTRADFGPGRATPARMVGCSAGMW